jgi:hypothetical protein
VCNIGISAAGYSLYTILSSVETGPGPGDGRSPSRTPDAVGVDGMGSKPG